MRRVFALPFMLAARKLYGSGEEFQAERTQLERAIGTALTGLVATTKPPQPVVHIENHTILDNFDAEQARAAARAFNAYAGPR